MLIYQIYCLFFYPFILFLSDCITFRLTMKKTKLSIYHEIYQSHSVYDYGLLFDIVHVVAMVKIQFAAEILSPF